MSERDTCGNCRHWRPDPDGAHAHAGYCYRYPPVAVGMRWETPELDRDDPACGEFSQRPFPAPLGAEG